jgi:hypothetical protein
MVKLTPEEIEILKRYLKFYQDLDFKKRVLKTDAQRRFKLVCDHKRAPKTIHEIAYLKYKKIIKYPRIIDLKTIDERLLNLHIRKHMSLSRLTYKEISEKLNCNKMVVIFDPEKNKHEIKVRAGLRRLNLYIPLSPILFQVSQ